MTNDIPMTVVGNLTDDPVVREHDGKRFGGFTIASTPRLYDQQTREWKDGVTTFMPVNVQDRHIRALEAERIGKGSGLVVTGILKTRGWTDRESGKPRSRMELTAESIGRLLLPPRRDAAPQGGGNVRPGTAGNEPWQGQQGGAGAPDAWQGQGGQYDDETPF